MTQPSVTVKLAPDRRVIIGFGLTGCSLSVDEVRATIEALTQAVDVIEALDENDKQPGGEDPRSGLPTKAQR